MVATASSSRGSSISTPTQPAPAPAAAATQSGSAKERLLAEQTSKYQAALAVAMDELTATQLQVQERSQIPELIRKDLQRIGSEVCETAKRLMHARHGSGAKTIVNAVLLMPVWRSFRRGGLLWKGAIVVGLWLIGIIVNLWSLPKEFRRAFEHARIENIPVHEAELAVLGFTHCDSGRLLAETWRLPADLRAVVSFHHADYQSNEHSGLIALVELSDLLCRMSGLNYGYPENRQINFLEQPGFAVLCAKCPALQNFDWARLTFELDSYMDEVHALVHAIYRT